MVLQKKKLAQVSMEYLSVIGFVILIISILVVLSLFYSRNVNDNVLLNQVDRLAKEIVDTSEKVYYWGPPSRITIKTYIPTQVESIQITNNQVVISVRTQNGKSDIAYSSPVNITGTINNTEGLRNIKVIAEDDQVFINGSTS